MLVITAIVRTVCNCVHSNKPVIDSKIMQPAIVSDSKTQNTLTPTAACSRITVPIGVASI